MSEEADLSRKITRPGQMVVAVLSFATAALIAIWLLMNWSTQYMIAFYVFIFIARLLFLGFDSMRRANTLADVDAAEPVTKKKRRTSTVLFTIGDVIVLSSVGLMALVLLTAGPAAGVSGVPMGLGIGIGYLFYLFAVPMRIFGR